MEVRILDDDGADVEPGAPGELVVRGFNVMLRYHDNPAATAEAIVDGWLRTGDIGFVDPDGNIHITDRLKDMFIVGGFNAYPGGDRRRAAAASLDRAGSRWSACPTTGWANRGWRSSCHAPRDRPRIRTRSCSGHGSDSPSTSSLASSSIDTLPLNPSGKVMKFVLRDRLADESETT